MTGNFAVQPDAPAAVDAGVQFNYLIPMSGMYD